MFQDDRFCVRFHELESGHLLRHVQECDLLHVHQRLYIDMEYIILYSVTFSGLSRSPFIFFEASADVLTPQY